MFSRYKAHFHTFYSGFAAVINLHNVRLLPSGMKLHISGGIHLHQRFFDGDSQTFKAISTIPFAIPSITYAI